MPKAKADATAVRTSALWLALAYLAKKRGVRALVAAGTSTPIALTVTAKVGRATITESIAGTLNIGADTEAADTTAADVNELLALLLREVGDADKQAATLERIFQQFATNARTLPTADAVTVERVAMWRKRFNAEGMKPKAGNLTFSITPPTEANAKKAA